jgi:predicted porin
MKKSLLALAVLGSFAGAVSAQTNVTIYGVVDAAVTYKNDGNPAGNTVKLSSGQQSGSRLGFKGSEDLGGGLSAIFTLENGFNVDDGTLAQSDDKQRLFGRQAWVGLAGNFGAVKLGRQETSLFLALNAIDPFRTNLAGNAQKVFAYGQYAADPLFRTDNTVSYSTPNIAGFSATASYGFGEKTDKKTDRTVGLGAQYANGPLNVQFAYQDSNINSLVGALADANGLDLGTARTDVKAAFIGATYDFGIAKAHLGYADNKLEVGAEEVKNNNWLVGVSAPVGAAGTVLASYVRNDFKDFDNAKSDQYAIGYTHALSKRTNLYTSYSYMKNDSDVALNAFAAGESVRLFNVGVRHSF